MALTKCPECDKEVSTTAETCPNCGYRLISKPQQAKKSIPKSAIIAIVAVLIVIAGIFAYNNMLWGNDKIAYDIAVKCAERSFYYPSSVQLLGGYFSTDKTCMWCRARAQSRSGAMTTDDWFFDGTDGGIASSSETKWCTATDNFNVDKVNQALKKHFR